MAGEPYNYGAQLANPMQAFTQGLQIGTVLDQQQAARAEEQAKRARAQEMAEAIRSVSTDRSPENLSRIMLTFPELKEQIAASQGVLSDAEKQDSRNFYAQVLMLRNAGQTERALQVAQDRADALKNTPGKEREAAMAGAMLEAFRKNPGDFDPAISLYLQATDPDFYKTITAAQGGDKQYDLNVQLFGKEEADRLRWGQQVKDTIVTATGPAGTTYAQADTLRPMPGRVAAASVAGGSAGPPQAAIDYLKANPGTKAQFEQKYGAGSAAQYMGGGASNGTGGFR